MEARKRAERDRSFMIIELEMRTVLEGVAGNQQEMSDKGRGGGNRIVLKGWVVNRLMYLAAETSLGNFAGQIVILQ